MDADTISYFSTNIVIRDLIELLQRFQNTVVVILHIPIEQSVLLSYNNRSFSP